MTERSDSVVTTALSLAHTAIGAKSFFWQRWDDRMYYLGNRVNVG